MSVGYAARNGARDVANPSANGVTAEVDFPIICETCLGSNPYLRMTKMAYASKTCKITNRPYQPFKWKAGAGGRYKETIVCREVAAERNVCQACLNDMKFGLPVGVRDALLEKSTQAQQLILPESIAGQNNYYHQMAEFNKQGSGSSGMIEDMANAVPNRQIDLFARKLYEKESQNKVAFRNLPKLCSFWLNGSCTRVTRKSCPFRPCCGTFLFPEIMGGATRELCSQLIADLERDGPAEVQKTISTETRNAFQQAMKGNREQAIRDRFNGKDDLAGKYVNRLKSSVRCSFVVGVLLVIVIALVLL